MTSFSGKVHDTSLRWLFAGRRQLMVTSPQYKRPGMPKRFLRQLGRFDLLKPAAFRRHLSMSLALSGTA
jgi:hypothetical protein